VAQASWPGLLACASQLVHVYHFHAEQFIPRPRPEVFRFFSDPRNLALITPPKLSFQILEGPAELRAGSRIRYRIRPFGIPMRWTSEIARWEPPQLFSDVQTSGPYRLWEHTHRFEESDGGTRILDDVRYALSCAPLVHPAVRRNIEGIFDYRRERIADLFGAPR
jgi:ligand-binding SRPBCC domain-containing protein